MQEYLDTAIEVVRRAGALQLARRGPGLRIDKKGAIDLVTEVDIEVERMFRALIAERYPDHTVLAEEQQGPAPEAGARCCWVFDPLDGTTNYAHGLPIFCSSLGLEIDGEAVVAAVYDPTRDELFTAVRGQGAYLNGVRLRVSECPVLVDALLCTGFPYDVHRSREEIVALFGEFVGRARAVRRLGSAALDLCYVAAGRLDGFWEQRLSAWDTCAGALIVAEAGGVVTRWDGTPFHSRHRDLVGANPVLHAQILDVIHEFQAARSGNRTD